MNLKKSTIGSALLVTLGFGPLSAQQAAPTNIARQPATATVQGLILTPANDRIPAVTVAAVRVFPIGQPNPITYAVANDRGIYSIEGLSNGSYNICVMPQGSGWLDPCLWSEDPPFVNLVAGQVIRQDVPLEEGVWLYVQVEDQDGSVATKELASGGPAYSISVQTTANLPERLTEAARDAKTRTFRIAVPRGKEISLAVRTSNLAVRKSDGNLVDPNVATKVTVNSTTQTVQFKVGQADAVQKGAAQ